MKRGTKKVLIIATCALFSLSLVSFSIVKANNEIGVVEDQPVALREVNLLRTEKGLSDLNWNSELAQAASDKAKDIVGQNYFDHVSPTGKKAWDFILQDGYEYKYAGENLAIDFNDIKEATLAWEESPSHYANIISPNYSDFGFAQLDGVIQGKETTVYVEIFGAKLSKYERVVINAQGGGNVN